jgi:hypothetical protein
MIWDTDKSWDTVSGGKTTGSVCIFVTNHQIYNVIATSHYCEGDLENFNELIN